VVSEWMSAKFVDKEEICKLGWRDLQTGHSSCLDFIRDDRQLLHAVWPHGIKRGFEVEEYCSKQTGHSKLLSINSFVDYAMVLCCLELLSEDLN